MTDGPFAEAKELIARSVSAASRDRRICWRPCAAICSRSGDLGVRVDERIVCAVAGSQEAHELFSTLHRAEMDAGHQLVQQLDAQDQLENRNLTGKQRAKLEDRRRTASSYAMADGLPIQRTQKRLSELARKYKKGCLAKLGVPVLPAR